MSGWDVLAEDLAVATCSLLLDGSRDVRRELTDVHAALACRDSLVVHLRDLVGAVADVPQYREAAWEAHRPAQPWPLTAAELVDRPAVALHRALSELPRTTVFGRQETAFHYERGLPVYEQWWRSAAVTLGQLEAFTQTVRDLAGPDAWRLAADLADQAAAVEHLDHHLSQAILPALKGGQDLAVEYAALTHPAHGAVRVTAGELRAQLHGTPRCGPAEPLSLPASELGQATDRFRQALRQVGAQVGMGDVRCAARIVETGELVARVLHRAGDVTPGAVELARALREARPVAERLRSAPAKSVCGDHLALVRAGTVLVQRVTGHFGAAERALAAGASAQDLGRFAEQAVDFAQQLPALTAALEVAVTDAVTDGQVLVPNSASAHSRRGRMRDLLWVSASMDRRDIERDGPHAVVGQARDLADAGTSIARSAEPVQAVLQQQARDAAMSGDGAASRAAAAARRHAGQSRAQLALTLNGLLANSPAPLAGPLTAHPGNAPDRQGLHLSP